MKSLTLKCKDSQEFICISHCVLQCFQVRGVVGKHCSFPPNSDVWNYLFDNDCCSYSYSHSTTTKRRQVLSTKDPKIITEYVEKILKIYIQFEKFKNVKKIIITELQKHNDVLTVAMIKNTFKKYFFTLYIDLFNISSTNSIIIFRLLVLSTSLLFCHSEVSYPCIAITTTRKQHLGR